MRIHSAIQSGNFPNATTLAVELEVSTKSIQRDLDFMRDRLSLPIEFHEAQRVLIRRRQCSGQCLDATPELMKRGELRFGRGLGEHFERLVGCELRLASAGTIVIDDRIARDLPHPCRTAGAFVDRESAAMKTKEAGLDDVVGVLAGAHAAAHEGGEGGSKFRPVRLGQY